MAYGDYVSSGTISGSSGGTTVTGSSTAWASGPQPLRAGDQLYVGGYVYPITAVASDTSLTVGIPLQASISLGTAYKALLGAPSRLSVTEIASSVSDLVAAAQFLTQSGGPIRCVGIGTNTPPSSPSTDDTYVIGGSPTGAWAGQSGNFGRWTGSAWYIEAAGLGAMAVDPNGADIYFKTTGGWVARSMSAGAVRYDTAQSLTNSQKLQSRTNIGATAWGDYATNIAGQNIESISKSGQYLGTNVTNAPSSDLWFFEVFTNDDFSWGAIIAIQPWYTSGFKKIKRKVSGVWGTWSDM